VNVPPDGDLRRTRRRAVLGAVAAVVVLGVLGLGVATGFTPQSRLDDAESRLFYVGDAAPPWLHDLLGVVTAPGLTVTRLVLFLPVVIWLVLRRAWWTAAWVVVAVAAIGPLTSLLKAGFDRVRPQFAGGGARLTTLSYPSGHSSGIATLVTVALILAWPLLDATRRRVALAVGVVAVVVVGLGRLWQGVHYLTDVLGGWSLGVAWTLALALAFRTLPGDRNALLPRAAAVAAEERP
jgi:membrane-associated phospholipid phosphatase